MVTSLRELIKWQDFNAKLSDFGLAREGPTGDQSHVSTQVMGTKGYAAPEYIQTGMNNWTAFMETLSIIYRCKFIY